MEGGSLRSVAQGSARSLLAPQEPTNVALYQVRASATHVQARGAAVSLGEPREPTGSWSSICPLPVTE